MLDHKTVNEQDEIFSNFRQDDDWGVNLGDTGADGVLDAGGDNIAVTAGTYNITLDITNNSYTMQKL